MGRGADVRPLPLSGGTQQRFRKVRRGDGRLQGDFSAQFNVGNGKCSLTEMDGWETGNAEFCPSVSQSVSAFTLGVGGL